MKSRRNVATFIEARHFASANQRRASDVTYFVTPSTASWQCTCHVYVAAYTVDWLGSGDADGAEIFRELRRFGAVNVSLVNSVTSKER